MQQGFQLNILASNDLRPRPRSDFNCNTYLLDEFTYLWFSTLHIYFYIFMVRLRVGRCTLHTTRIDAAILFSFVTDVTRPECLTVYGICR